jgi:hypothetical protein
MDLIRFNVFVCYFEPRGFVALSLIQKIKEIHKMRQTDIDFFNGIDPEEQDDYSSFSNYSCRPLKQTRSRFNRLTGDC